MSVRHMCVKGQSARAAPRTLRSSSAARELPVVGCDGTHRGGGVMTPTTSDPTSIVLVDIASRDGVPVRRLNVPIHYR